MSQMQYNKVLEKCKKLKEKADKQPLKIKRDKQLYGVKNEPKDR